MRDQIPQAELVAPMTSQGRKARDLAPLLMVAGLAVAACTPTVQLQAPKDPITINLNIQADVRVKIEEAAQKDIDANPDIFGD
jgi:hypothetical protein